MKKGLFPYVAIFVNILMTCTIPIMGYKLYDVAYATGFSAETLFIGLLYALLIYQIFWWWKAGIKIWKGK